jgi:branched-chain amino acid transport system substrate-binding protein
MPLLLSCNFNSDSSIKIGFIGSLSGSQNFLGTSGRDGALLAIEEINQQGGLNGRHVELLVKDIKHNHGAAKQAMVELVDDGVVAVVGPMTSEMSGPIIDVANQHEIVVLSPSVASHVHSNKDDYFLRLYPSATEGSIKVAHFGMHDRQLDSFAVIYDMTNSSFSLSWLESFKKDYQSLGGKLLIQIPFESQKDSISYLDLATRIHESGAKGLLVLANPFSTAMITQSLTKLDSQIDSYITEWSYGPDLLMYGGRNVDNLMLFKTYFKDASSPATVVFRDKFENRFGVSPWFSSVHSYDAASFLLEALAKNPDETQLKETMLNYGEYQGVQTSFALNQFGDIIRSHYITRLNLGREVFVARLDAPYSYH